MTKPIVNLNDLEYRPWGEGFPDGDKPPADYGACKAQVSSLLGARKLGYNVTAIAPGKAAFPAHNHRVNEEMFLILAGEGELSVGEECWPVREGDVIACPPGGPETAHQLRNTSTRQDLKVLGVSTFEETDVVEYPESGKVSFGVMTPGADGQPDLLRAIFKEDDQTKYWGNA